MSKRSILWVAKKPSEAATGGDEVYNKNATKSLSSEFDIQKLWIDRQSKINNLSALIKGLPHPRFKYYSPDIIREFNEATREVDSVVVSWESFDFLPAFSNKPTTLIVHNVMSDTLRQVFKGRGRIVGQAAAYQSERWERRIYADGAINIVVLSKRDYNVIRKIAPRAVVSIAPPGCPPASELASERFIPEVVISGTFEWAPKLRDLIVIARQYDSSDFSFIFRHDHPLPLLSPPSLLNSESEPIQEKDFQEGLRIGLIPDTFLGGFKLKSSYYIAMNCIVATMCDIREEFIGIPHADEFVRLVHCIDDIQKLVDEFRVNQNPRTFQRWREFKAACLSKFSWKNTASIISHSIYGARKNPA